MANVKFAGIEDIEAKFLRREQNTVRAVPKMVVAGGQVLQKAQRDVARQMFKGDRSTGDLANSIKSDTKAKGDNIRKYVTVYPRGKDRHGVKNATKGFVLQYGRTNMPAKPWLTIANNNAEQPVQDIMRKTWEDEQNG